MTKKPDPNGISDEKDLRARIADAVLSGNYPRGPSDEDIARVENLVANGSYPKIEPKTEGGPLGMKSNKFTPSPATKINPFVPFGGIEKIRRSIMKKPDPIGELLKRNGIDADSKDADENKSAEQKAAEDGDVMIGATGAQKKADLGDILNRFKTSGMDGIRKMIEQFGGSSNSGNVDEELKAKIASATMPNGYPKGPSDEDIDRVMHNVTEGNYPKAVPTLGKLPSSETDSTESSSNGNHTIPDLAIRTFGKTFGSRIGLELTYETVHCNVIDAGRVTFDHCNVIVGTIDSNDVKIKESTLCGSPKVYTRHRGMRLTDCILDVADSKSDMTNDERLDVYSARLSEAFNVEKDLVHSYLETVSDWIDANVIVIPSQTCSVEGLAFEYGRSGSVKIENEMLLNYCIVYLLTKFNPYQDYVTAQNVYVEGKWRVLLKGCVLDGTKVKDALRSEEEVKRQSAQKSGIGGIAGMFGAMGGIGGMGGMPGMPSMPSIPTPPIDVPNQVKQPVPEPAPQSPMETVQMDIVIDYLKRYYHPVNDGDEGYSDIDRMVKNLRHIYSDVFTDDDSAVRCIRNAIDGDIYGDGRRFSIIRSPENEDAVSGIVWIHDNDHFDGYDKARILNWISEGNVQLAEGFGFSIRDLYNDYSKPNTCPIDHRTFSIIVWNLLTVDRILDNDHVSVDVSGGTGLDPAIDAYYFNVARRCQKHDGDNGNGDEEGGGTEDSDSDSHGEFGGSDNVIALVDEFIKVHTKFVPDASVAIVDLRNAFLSRHPSVRIGMRRLYDIIFDTINRNAEAAKADIVYERVPSNNGRLVNGFRGVKYLEQKSMQPLIDDDILLSVNHEPWDENFESFTKDEIFDWAGAFLRNACFHQPNSCITLPALKKFFIQWMGLPEDFRYSDDAEDSKDLIADSLMIGIDNYQWIDGVTFHLKHGNHKNVFVDIGCIFAKHTNPRDRGIIGDEPLPEKANLVDAVRDFVYRNCIPNAESHISVTDLREQFIDTLPKNSRWLDVDEDTFMKAVSEVFNGTGRFGSTRFGTYTDFEEDGSVASQYNGFSYLSYRPSGRILPTYDRGLNPNDSVFDYVSRFLQFFYMPGEEVRSRSTENMFKLFCDYSNIEISYPSFAAMIGRALNGLRAGDGTIGAAGRNWNIVEATDMQQEFVTDVEYPRTLLNCCCRNPALEDISVKKHAAE